MSLRKKMFMIALGAALAIFAGRNLSTLQSMVGAVASAVWGS
ncbi:MAG TPA: hypothetical protein VKL99_01945 [Candidatus Angelobacter sp.]|nr:hypothetical protein [Candidatus Angelobacter sp.]